MKNEKGAVQLIVLVEVLLILTAVLFGLVVWTEVKDSSESETTSAITTSSSAQLEAETTNSVDY